MGGVRGGGGKGGGRGGGKGEQQSSGPCVATPNKLLLWLGGWGRVDGADWAGAYGANGIGWVG